MWDRVLLVSTNVQCRKISTLEFFNLNIDLILLRINMVFLFEIGMLVCFDLFGQGVLRIYKLPVGELFTDKQMSQFQVARPCISLSTIYIIVSKLNSSSRRGGGSREGEQNVG